jgi:hypothetical protein
MSKLCRSGLLGLISASIVAIAVISLACGITVALRHEWRSLDTTWEFWHSRTVTRALVDAGRWSARPPTSEASFKALEHIRDKKIFIAGVLRDNAVPLPKSLKLIDTIGALFKEYSVALYENDSTDATPQILADWAHDHNNAANIHVVSEKLDAPSAISHGDISEGRFSKLAKFRNRYIDLFNQHAPDADYVVIIDLDLYALSLDAFLSNFSPEGLAHNWSIVGANGMCSNRRYVFYQCIIVYVLDLLIPHPHLCLSLFIATTDIMIRLPFARPHSLILAF